jgi:hypothetical protein
MTKARNPTRSTKRHATVTAPMRVRDRTTKLTTEERAARIAERAYLLAEQRGFGPGGELSDWLAAEHEVDAELAASNAS